VIGHHHVNGVFRSPLRHVAVEHVRAAAHCRPAGRRRDAGVCAALADRDVTLHGLGAARDVVRVVTRDARHLAALKARRLAQAVRAAGDLELVVAPGAPGA
jgi:hypothetical protein